MGGTPGEMDNMLLVGPKHFSIFVSKFTTLQHFGSYAKFPDLSACSIPGCSLLLCGSKRQGGNMLAKRGRILQVIRRRIMMIIALHRFSGIGRYGFGT